MDHGKWAQIVHLQQCAKSLILLAEEHDEIDDWKTLPQPLLEQRNALDHVCRVMAVEVGVKTDVAPDYIDKNLDKTVGHMYRAFFDIADWSSIVIRRHLLRAVRPYNPECIKENIPEFYPEIRPRIERISTIIAGIRRDKDIGGEHCSIIELVVSYEAIVRELWQYYELICSRIPGLNEYKTKQRLDFFKKWGWAIVAAVVGGIFLFWITQHATK